MSESFIFIGTHKLKDGKLEDFKKSCGELSEFVESNEPRMIAFNFYGSEDGMRLLREHISGARGEEGSLDVTTSVQVYGPPGEALEMIKRLSQEGVPLIVKPQPLAGFTRSAAE
jgi:hypothetical protein